MLIVIASIPLSILTSIACLHLAGQTINTMTLGGIALAVGMLVDDATVEIENIHRNHAMNKPLLVAILDGAHQIATPTFVGTLSICIVFFPVVLLTGVARFLFTPLALAVVFAMLTSYLLSRTLVPTMASYLLPEKHQESPRQWAVGTIPPRVRSRLRAHPQALRVGGEHFHRVSRPLADLRRADDRRHDPAAVRDRRGFLSDGGRRTDEISCARAERNANRADHIDR